jgi:hypothetical protein
MSQNKHKTVRDKRGTFPFLIFSLGNQVQKEEIPESKEHEGERDGRKLNLQGVGVVDISFKSLERAPEGQRPATMKHDFS